LKAKSSLSYFLPHLSFMKKHLVVPPNLDFLSFAIFLKTRKIRKIGSDYAKMDLIKNETAINFLSRFLRSYLIVGFYFDSQGSMPDIIIAPHFFLFMKLLYSNLRQLCFWPQPRDFLYWYLNFRAFLLTKQLAILSQTKISCSWWCSIWIG
jgi:hypothetical protein